MHQIIKTLMTFIWDPQIIRQTNTHKCHPMALSITGYFFLLLSIGIFIRSDNSPASDIKTACKPCLYAPAPHFPFHEGPGLMVNERCPNKIRPFIQDRMQLYYMGGYLRRGEK